MNVLSPQLLALVPKLDYHRGPSGVPDARVEHKEWQHFVVHTPRTTLLVNFSVVGDVWARNAEVARLVVLARRDGWDGDVERFEPAEVDVAPGSLTARLGASSLRFEGGRYHVSIALRERQIAADLRFVPRAIPALANNQILSRERSLSWFFVPRLAASGTVSIDGEEEEIEDAPAYHDHNWGRFRWGDDFSWEWGSVLPRDARSQLGVVMMRVTDRARTVSRSQSLSLWRGEGHPVVFRDGDLHVRAEGRLAMLRRRHLRLPRAMSLLAAERAHDIPARVLLEGHNDDGDITLIFGAEDVAELVLPSETDGHRVVSLYEVTGEATLRGEVRGETIDLEGAGVFEICRA
jgi:hypothetical protein